MLTLHYRLLCALPTTVLEGAPTPACGGAQGGQNFPFRGGKCSCWEGGLRGTAFVHSPLLPASAVGKETFSIMHAVDVLPTLVAAAAGGEAYAALLDWYAGEGRPLDGVSQWEVIAGGNVSAVARTEVMLEADPHSLPLQRQYCGDQHGAGQYSTKHKAQSKTRPLSARARPSPAMCSRGP